QLHTELLGERAGKGVRTSGGGKRHDQRDGAVGPVRGGGAGRQGQVDAQRGRPGQRLNRVAVHFISSVKNSSRGCLHVVLLYGATGRCVGWFGWWIFSSVEVGKGTAPRPFPAVLLGGLVCVAQHVLLHLAHGVAGQ